ncbi:hypothetical protein AVEN_64545-1 [Araneus ventricosus]|uniref:Uncharacterized protein n=1 Tax=Araneus ventricosus TaxID=182803 RepID=A0A4Y2X5J6_ARAVE|nr:hypothetical protein AVEN_64545-1 [Araneus ventricosus]
MFFFSECTAILKEFLVDNLHAIEENLTTPSPDGKFRIPVITTYAYVLNAFEMIETASDSSSHDTLRLLSWKWHHSFTYEEYLK